MVQDSYTPFYSAKISVGGQPGLTDLFILQLLYSVQCELTVLAFPEELFLAIPSSPRKVVRITPTRDND